MMCQCLEDVDSFCEGGVGACTPLEVAVASVGPFISITPTIGMAGGEGDIEVGGQWVERYCLRLEGCCLVLSGRCRLHTYVHYVKQFCCWQSLQSNLHLLHGISMQEFHYAVNMVCQKDFPEGLKEERKW